MVTDRQFMTAAVSLLMRKLGVSWAEVEADLKAGTALTAPKLNAIAAELQPTMTVDDMAQAWARKQVPVLEQPVEEVKP